MRDHLMAILLSVAIALGAATCSPSDEGSPTVNQYATPPPAASPGAPAAAAAPASGQLRMTTFEIGRSVNPDNTMHDATVVFIPTDQVWISVIIEGVAPHATLQGRFLTDGGAILEQSSQEITPTGRTAAVFHAERHDGWSTGHYRVEILLNGVAVGSREYEVRQPPL